MIAGILCLNTYVTVTKLMYYKTVPGCICLFFMYFAFCRCYNFLRLDLGKKNKV